MAGDQIFNHINYSNQIRKVFCVGFTITNGGACIINRDKRDIPYQSYKQYKIEEQQT